MHLFRKLICILPGLISAISPGLLCAKDDDFAFAKSLANRGYFWIAEKELGKLAQSSDRNERILRYLVLAEVRKGQNKLPEMIECYNTFIEEAGKSSDPFIKKKKDEIQVKLYDVQEEALISYVNKIEGEFNKEKPDQDKLRTYRKEAKAIGAPILAFRRKTYKDLSEKMNKAGAVNDQNLEVELAKSNLFLARTLYYYSFAFKGGDEGQRRKLLKEARNKHLKNLMFNFGERVILVPFFNGMVLWELKKYKEAALSLHQCNAHSHFMVSRFDQIRKVAYTRAVEAYFKAKHYKACAEEAFSYLIDYPGEDDKKSYQGQVIRITLAKAVRYMTSADYREIQQKFNWKKEDKEEKAVELAQEIEAENSYKSAEAREFMRNSAKGWVRQIAEGVAQYHEKDYQKAVSALQKGLKDVPDDIPMEQKLTKIAQAWYYLGFSYYHLDMKLPSVIAFKEGTTRFMKLFEDNKERLNETQKRWYLENRKNWKTSAGLYYRDTRSSLAVEIFKEALITFAQGEGRGEEGEESAGRDIHLNLAIIMAKNEDYAQAVEELDKVDQGSASYSKALRLKGKFTWALFKKEGKNDLTVAEKAFGYFKKLGTLLRKEIASAEKEEKEELRNELAEADAFVIQMHYGMKQYEDIITGIESFWKNPPKSKDVAFSALRYQIYAVIQMKTADTDKGIGKRYAYHMKAYKLIEKISGFSDREYDEKKQKTLKGLGFSFFNLSRSLSSVSHKEKKEKALNVSGELLFEFIMNADESVDERILIAVADILYNRLKDYKRSEKVTERILAIFKTRIKGKFPPYDEETEKQLDEMKVRLFDREDARRTWELMSDRMHDGRREKDNAQISREMFKTIRKEAWGDEIGEKPYMYEDAYVRLSEAVMLELGYSERRREELAAQRDSEKAEESEKFWTDLISDYKDTVNRDPGDILSVQEFLDNAILANNYKDRLAQCYLKNGKHEEAYKLYKELDEYYMFEPVTKSRMADTLLKMARSTDNEDIRKEYAEKAKETYLWIKVHAPPQTLEGRKEHFDAAFKMAECWEVLGNPEAAKKYLEVLKKHGGVPFPNSEYREKLDSLIRDYGEKAAKKTGNEK